jgi:rod shape-determining protein MreC
MRFLCLLLAALLLQSCQPRAKPLRPVWQSNELVVVTYNSPSTYYVDGQNNFITLHRGSNQGVDVNMAVIGPEGVVGKIVNVSPNMSVAMSLLHRKNSVVALLKKGGGFGEVTWDGKDPRFVTLSNIPRTIKVAKGDTVVTSSYSDIFPPGKVVGYVAEVREDKSSSTYSLKVKTATDFYSVQHAYVVKNIQKAEMDSLMLKVKKD